MPPRTRTAKAAPVETAPAADLPMRSCVVCGQHDDHPRCLVDDGTGADLNYHKDCHRNAFGDLPCHAVLTAGGDGLKGDALRAHIVKNGS